MRGNSVFFSVYVWDGVFFFSFWLCSLSNCVLQNKVFFQYQTLCFHADRDFEPPCEEEDDEETIEVEEQQEGNDAESHRREIELLKEEGMLPLDQLLSSLNLPQVGPQTRGQWLFSEKNKSTATIQKQTNFTDVLNLTWLSKFVV